MAVHSYFDMFTYKVLGGTEVLLSYAVSLPILPTFDLGKAHGEILIVRRK